MLMGLLVRGFIEGEMFNVLLWLEGLRVPIFFTQQFKTLVMVLIRVRVTLLVCIL